MIIKMKQGDGWEFIDGLNNVLHWPISGSIDSEKNRTTEYDEVHYGISADIGFPTSVGISAKNISGKSILILANLDVYLLNDGGKTIERLN